MYRHVVQTTKSTEVEELEFLKLIVRYRLVEERRAKHLHVPRPIGNAKS